MESLEGVLQANYPAVWVEAIALSKAAVVLGLPKPRKQLRMRRM